MTGTQDTLIPQFKQRFHANCKSFCESNPTRLNVDPAASFCALRFDTSLPRHGLRRKAFYRRGCQEQSKSRTCRNRQHGGSGGSKVKSLIFVDNKGNSLPLGFCFTISEPILCPRRQSDDGRYHTILTLLWNAFSTASTLHSQPFSLLFGTHKGSSCRIDKAFFRRTQHPHTDED